MRDIVYDFAMTIDGFICREDGSAEGFIPNGGHLTDYLARLEQYDTVIMGRRTYEFGYEFGLKPGDRAYAHMDHYIFSNSLTLDSDQVNVVGRDDVDLVRRLKAASGREIYLCGGGVFAGMLLEQKLIDQIVIKLNPVLFGQGRKPFSTGTDATTFSLVESKEYDNGVALLRYNVAYI